MDQLTHLHRSMASVLDCGISLVVVLELDVPKPVHLLLKLLVQPEPDASKLLYVLLEVELDISRRFQLLHKVKAELADITQLLRVLELDVSNLAPIGTAIALLGS